MTISIECRTARSFNFFYFFLKFMAIVDRAGSETPLRRINNALTTVTLEL